MGDRANATGGVPAGTTEAIFRPGRDSRLVPRLPTDQSVGYFVSSLRDCIRFIPPASCPSSRHGMSACARYSPRLIHSSFHVDSLRCALWAAYGCLSRFARLGIRHFQQCLSLVCMKRSKPSTASSRQSKLIPDNGGWTAAGVCCRRSESSRVLRLISYHQSHEFRRFHRRCRPESLRF